METKPLQQPSPQPQQQPTEHNQQHPHQDHKAIKVEDLVVNPNKLSVRETLKDPIKTTPADSSSDA